MSTQAARIDRTTVIRDPIQRAVAKHIGEILDLFSDRFVAIRKPEARLAAVPGKADARGRVRNLMRPLAIGMIASLLLDLGAPRSRIHGWTDLCGCTEIVELTALHPHSVMQCATTFAAMRDDQSEIGVMVAARYERMLGQCRRYVLKAGGELPATEGTGPERERVARVRARRGVIVDAHEPRVVAKRRDRKAAKRALAT